jgi:MFS family permease
MQQNRWFAFSRVVWLLSLVSLMTDLASELLYPVLPLYLKQIGYNEYFIGWVEGLADAVSGLAKGYFGAWSDLAGKRVPFVRLGYFLSAVSKPLMILSLSAYWVLAVRSLDRLGKGIRTGARDALLASQTTPDNKATVFGFHRSMDTLGAVLGPVAALVYLYFYPNDYATLFMIAFFPGLIAVFITYLLREKAPAERSTRMPGWRYFSFFRYWRQSSPAYRKLVLGLLLFYAFNSSDVFLLLQLKARGYSDTAMILMYVYYNIIYALAAYPLGIRADQVGLKRMFLFGLVIFAIVYAGMAHLPSETGIFLAGLLFTAYGLYAAATESIAKAWISRLVPVGETGSALGFFAGMQSIAFLTANLITGAIWSGYGAWTALMLPAGMTILVILYFVLLADE